MNTETERKFLVRGDAYKQEAFQSERIVQGYLSSVPGRTVRVRRKGEKGYLTIKGPGNRSGMSRLEWEKEIAPEEAQELMTLCEPGVIDKVRYKVKAGPFVWEVDEFRGDNEGLVMAEIELPDEQASFEKPAWIGEEVTGDSRYYNSMLSKSPYTCWNK